MQFLHIWLIWPFYYSTVDFIVIHTLAYFLLMQEFRVEQAVFAEVLSFLCSVTQ